MDNIEEVCNNITSPGYIYLKGKVSIICRKGFDPAFRDLVTKNLLISFSKNKKKAERF